MSFVKNSVFQDHRVEIFSISSADWRQIPGLEVVGYANLGLHEILEIAGPGVHHSDAFICKCFDTGLFEAHVRLGIGRETFEATACAENAKPALASVCQQLYCEICGHQGGFAQWF